ncbi:MAG: hypothetical protein JSR21_17515 [Proteobacteria bacterium]|nr:hypothetical protein [Pseudomonadota bacterium]
MPELLSRQRLYELVWSEPMNVLAARLGISGTGLAKACHRLHVPTPPQGYWLRKATKRTAGGIRLPPRPPGCDDETMIGGGPYWRHYQPRPSEAELLGPLPPAPTFEEPTETVRQRIEAALRKPRSIALLDHVHPAVAALLRSDEARVEAAKTGRFLSSWEKPRYQLPVERRRLKLVSRILRAAAPLIGRVNVSEDLYDSVPATVFTVMVGHQAVRLEAAVKPVAGARKRAQGPSQGDGQIVNALGAGKDRVTWEDGGRRLEQIVRDIAIELVLQGEEDHRAQVMGRYEWRVQARADLIERLRRQREEAERRERERLAELERQRIERLLGEAESLRKASTIRRYVADAVRVSKASHNGAVPQDARTWADWALAQANRIDPIRSGVFRHWIEAEPDERSDDHNPARLLHAQE